MPGPETLARRKVAVIEDDELLRNSLALFLREKGCDVKTFARAEDACGMESFNAVISDYLLPGEDGLSFLRRVHDASKDVLTILFTAYAKRDLSEEARLAGIDFFLPKPINVSELERTLEQMVHKGLPKADGHQRRDE